jgi:hypothetical protein
MGTKCGRKNEKKSTDQAGIKEVAAGGGVSIATVIRVLNGTAYVGPRRDGGSKSPSRHCASFRSRRLAPLQEIEP